MEQGPIVYVDESGFALDTPRDRRKRTEVLGKSRLAC